MLLDEVSQVLEVVVEVTGLLDILKELCFPLFDSLSLGHDSLLLFFLLLHLLFVGDTESLLLISFLLSLIT